MFDLKIGRHTYTIKKNDLFMDNGACVQLISQSQERVEWGHRPSPHLSKKAIKAISSYKRNQVKHDYGERVQVFSLIKEAT